MSPAAPVHSSRALDVLPRTCSLSTMLCYRCAILDGTGCWWTKTPRSPAGTTHFVSRLPAPKHSRTRNVDVARIIAEPGCFRTCRGGLCVTLVSPSGRKCRKGRLRDQHQEQGLQPAVREQHDRARRSHVVGPAEAKEDSDSIESHLAARRLPRRGFRVMSVGDSVRHILLRHGSNLANRQTGVAEACPHRLAGNGREAVGKPKIANRPSPIALSVTAWGLSVSVGSIYRPLRDRRRFVGGRESF